MQLRTQTKNAFVEHALRDYPREACGIVIAEGDKEVYIPCRNIAENGQDFAIAAEEFAAAEDRGKPIALLHSHIDRGPEPTELDRVSCEATGLPWWILAVRKDVAGEMFAKEWATLKPNGYVAPLVGRSFYHGTLDCYGLIRDFYSRELGIILPDFPRKDKWWEDKNADELYLNNFEKAGFVRVDDGPRYADVILMQYRSDKTNHGGVFLGEEKLKTEPDLPFIPQAMLHHAMPRLSERVMYAGYWADITRMIIRHKSNV